MARSTPENKSVEKKKSWTSTPRLSPRHGRCQRSQEFILDRNYVLDLVNSLESVSE